MEIKYEEETNRVGIYTQTSVEATAIGGGFAPEGEKSPVALRGYETYGSERNQCPYGENIGFASASSDFCQSSSENYGNRENPFKRNIDFSNFEQPIASRKKKTKKKNTIQRKIMNQPKREVTASRDANKPSTIKEFPQSVQYFGKDRWQRALTVLKDLKFAAWEINPMLGSLDSLVKEKQVENEAWPPSPKEEIKSEEIFKEPDLSTAVEEEIKDYDLRINIGDASHPNFHILPEYRNALRVELNLLMKEENSKVDKALLVGAHNLLYTNNTLLVLCKTANTVDFIKSKLSEMNKLWEGARLVLCPKIGTRKKIKICLPSYDLSTYEIFKIISKQNRLETQSWIVTRRCDDMDRVCLDVVVDALTYVRFFKDQDDMHFLLTRATLKEIT